MTLVYDPLMPSKGRRIAKRSRRRRNTRPSLCLAQAKPTKAPTKSNQEQMLGGDLLNFCNQLEEKVPKSKSSTHRHISQTISLKRASAPPTIFGGKRKNSRRQTALAVDTRFMEVLRDTDLSQSIIQNIQSLLHMTANRGVAPSVLSVSHLKQTPKGVCSIGVKSSIPSNTDLEPLYIQTQSLEAISPENEEAINGDGVVFQLPHLLAAKASWQLFGDYVISILQNAMFQESPPCHRLTLLTNDLSFLSDTRTNVHAYGLDTFWEQCKPFFLEHKLGSIEIVVLCTNSQIIDSKDGATAMPNEHVAEKRHGGNVHAEEEATSTPPRQTIVTECIAALNQEIREKEEAEFRANRSNIQFDVTQHIPNIAISVSTLENSPLGMMSLLRKWSRDQVAAAQRLTLHLPDTGNYASHEELALDSVYKTIPFALDSDLILGLQNDLILLAQSKLEATKVVPIASIDASLLYGVPIRVRSGLQVNMESHQVMMQMVQSLFHLLSQKEQALIVTSSLASTVSTEGLFQSSQKHTFVLMAEETHLLLRSTIPPSTGILLRLATSDQFIEEVGAFDVVSAVVGKDKNPFSESMKQALDSIAYLDSDLGYNPIYSSALQSGPHHIQHQSEEDSSVPSETRNENIEMELNDKWNDDSGVGSSKASLNAAQQLIADKNVAKAPGEGNLSRKQPKSDSLKPYESELEETDTVELHRLRKIKTIPLTVDRKRFPPAAAGEPTKDDEVEWTDDDGVSSFKLGELLSDSDDSDDVKEPTVGVFEYSD